MFTEKNFFAEKKISLKKNFAQKKYLTKKKNVAEKQNFDKKNFSPKTYENIKGVMVGLGQSPYRLILF